MFWFIFVVYAVKYILHYFAEHKHVQDCKEETEDIAISEQPQVHGGGSSGAAEAGKRSSAEMGPDTDQSTSSKRVRVSSEVNEDQLMIKTIPYMLLHILD